MPVKLQRASTTADVLNKKYENYEIRDSALKDCFGSIPKKGVWFILGGSGSGKSALSLQIAKELALLGVKVYNNELEEEDSEEYQKRLKTLGMHEVKKFFTIHDSLEELKTRLKKSKAAKIVIINSATYQFKDKEEYFEFANEFKKKKLIIIIAHADGSKPATELERRIMFDAHQKIFCEAYKATNRGRRFNKINTYIIWEDGHKKSTGK